VGRVPPFGPQAAKLGRSCSLKRRQKFLMVFPETVITEGSVRSVENHPADPADSWWHILLAGFTLLGPAPDRIPPGASVALREGSRDAADAGPRRCEEHPDRLLRHRRYLSRPERCRFGQGVGERRENAAHALAVFEEIGHTRCPVPEELQQKGVHLGAHGLHDVQGQGVAAGLVGM
jgi:hypothetical protein